MEGKYSHDNCDFIYVPCWYRLMSTGGSLKNFVTNWNLAECQAQDEPICKCKCSDWLYVVVWLSVGEAMVIARGTNLFRVKNDFGKMQMEDRKFGIWLMGITTASLYITWLYDCFLVIGYAGSQGEQFTVLECNSNITRVIGRLHNQCENNRLVSYRKWISMGIALWECHCRHGKTVVLYT